MREPSAGETCGRIDHSYGPSRFVELDDGRQLHYRIRGPGTATVVFESGMGLSGAIWGQVQPAVSARATTVVYNRAGAGLSDDDSAPRTLERIVADLAHLLRTLHGPFILVGASWGGPIVRSLAATGEFPILGLVLVDQADENAPEYFTRMGERRIAYTGPFTMFLARTGLYRLMARIGRDQPADVYADLRRHDFGVRGARLMAAEAAEFLPAMRALRDAQNRLDGIAVAVLTGTKTNLVERSTRPAINRAHRITAEQLMHGHLVEAENSGHYIMFTQPELIVREIERMLDRAPA